MKRYVYFLFLSVFIAGLAILHFKDQGTINILWLGYEVTLSVMTGLLILLATFFGYRYLNLFFHWLSQLPLRWKAFFDRLKQRRASQDELFALARTSLETSLWKDARAYLMILLQKSPTPRVYQLLAILELQERNDSRAAMSWLEKGLITPENFPTLVGSA